MRWLVLAVLACGCSGKPAAPPVTGSGATGSSCDALRGKVEQLYRTEARTREPGRVNEAVNEAVADNTAMVMTDCAKAPAKATACISAATTVAELEALSRTERRRGHRR